MPEPGSLQWWNTVSNFFFFLNIFLAIFLLFYERKSPSSAWAWVMILFFVPVVGFVLYLLFGKPLSQKHLRQHTDYSYPQLNELADEQLQEIDSGTFHSPIDEAHDLQNTIRMLLKSDPSPLTRNNRFHIFTDGKLKFDALFQDIEKARHHIHLQYFIVKNDELGKHLVHLLTKKANEGVKVLFLYDAIGSKKLPNDFFSALQEAGGRTEPFLPAQWPFINFRINHRNHRKLAIIDGATGYIGSFNVGEEYLGEKEKFGYWRGTHLRVEGDAVHYIQNRFLIDWNTASRTHPVHYASSYFPPVDIENGAATQIVASGPDTSDRQIKNGIFQLITKARQSIYVQTPYLVPDKTVQDAFYTAALSGIDVKIMIPHQADHPFVYSASLSFAHELMKAGAKIYKYENGFLHAKTIIVDGKAFSVGSANMDMRSFLLNFEANAFVYDKTSAEEMTRIFFRDLELSKELTMDSYEDRSLYTKIKQRIARLLAPIL